MSNNTPAFGHTCVMKGTCSSQAGCALPWLLFTYKLTESLKTKVQVGFIGLQLVDVRLKKIHLFVSIDLHVKKYTVKSIQLTASSLLVLECMKYHHSQRRRLVDHSGVHGLISLTWQPSKQIVTQLTYKSQLASRFLRSVRMTKIIINDPLLLETIRIAFFHVIWVYCRLIFKILDLI